MAASSGKCYVTFHCRCPDTKPGDEVCLLGGAPSLGSWQLPRRIRLSTSAAAFPLWSSGAVVLPAGVEVKYKYLITPHCSCNLLGGAYRATKPLCSCSSSDACRWETISGHDSSGNRILRLSGGNHDLFDKFSQCDLPPLSMASVSQSVVWLPNSHSSPRHRNQRAGDEEPAIESELSKRYPTKESDALNKLKSSSCLAGPNQTSQDATVRLNMLKSVERLCKLQAAQVGDLRQTMERSLTQMLGQLVESRAEDKRGKVTTQVAAEVADSAAAKAVASVADSIKIALQEARELIVNEVKSAVQALETNIIERAKQAAAEALAESAAGTTARLDEAMEKLIGTINRRSISGVSVASLGTGAHSTGSISASTTYSSQAFALADDNEAQLPHGSHRRSHSADVETRFKREKITLDLHKELHVSNDLASNVTNTYPSSSDFTYAVLASKDPGADLTWIQTTLYDIKRENANIRQLLGMICHTLDTAVCQQKHGNENAEDGNAKMFHISSPKTMSRESSSASLCLGTEGASGSSIRSASQNTARKSFPSGFPVSRGASTRAMDDGCPGSPRAVVETGSICMAKSLEKFNSKKQPHPFPNIYTTSGNKDWEQFISTNKGIHRGSP